MPRFEFFTDCANCGQRVHISAKRKKKKEVVLCSECKRYVELPVADDKQPGRVIGGGFLLTVTRPKTTKWGKNGRPLKKSVVKLAAMRAKGSE